MVELCNLHHAGSGFEAAEAWQYTGANQTTLKTHDQDQTQLTLLPLTGVASPTPVAKQKEGRKEGRKEGVMDRYGCTSYYVHMSIHCGYLHN